jgi:hypothetical protein
MRMSVAMIASVATSAVALSATGGAAGAQAQTSAQAQAPGYEATKATLWALEQSIYAMRARGSMAVIIDSQSPYSRGWPSISQALNSTAIKKPFTSVRGANSLKSDKERVQLIFLDMAYDGHTAVMMYKTHKTQMSDGAPADDYFEVTHVWSKDDGQWRLLTGRPQPVSPPQP